MSHELAKNALFTKAFSRSLQAFVQNAGIVTLLLKIKKAFKICIIKICISFYTNFHIKKNQFISINEKEKLFYYSNKIFLLS